MTRYVDQLTNNTYELYEIRNLHPNLSIPAGADLSSLGFTPLIETPQPAALPWHRVMEGPPVNSTQTWIQQSLSTADIIHECTWRVQQRLDDFAKTRNYDNILSACTYATSTIPKFHTEGQYCVNLRDSTWNQCYAILAEVQAGTRVMPTIDELMALLPTPTWPV